MCWPSRAWCVLDSFLISSSSSRYGYLLCSTPSFCNSAYGNDFEEFHLLSARMEFDQNHGQQRVPKDLSDALVWKKNSLLQMILIRLYDIIEVCLDLFVRVLDIIEVGLGLQQPTLWYHRVGWCKSKLTSTISKSETKNPNGTLWYHRVDQENQMWQRKSYLRLAFRSSSNSESEECGSASRRLSKSKTPGEEISRWM